MTIREVSEILGVKPDSLRFNIRKRFPGLMQNGVETMLTEEQVAELKRGGMRKRKVRVAVQGKYTGKIYTLAEAAAYIRMGKSTLYAKERKGIIPSIPQSQTIKLFHIDVLDAWLKGEVPAGTVGDKADRKKEVT
jgi:hypothetical protein